MTDRRRIQRFEILAVLGDGGMGTVYRARDPQLEREVAIKILHDTASGVRSGLDTEHTVDLRGGPRTRRRDDLLQEARMMARLSHPNVVPIYEVGLDDRGDVFVVMEYVAGDDLRRWLTTERTPTELARIFAQAARGLAAAHACGIVHRDFKPDNVLIGNDGRARVGDFGISKLAAPTGLVMTARVAGTPKYMAPELWRGEPATAASDVFALCTTILDAYGDREFPARALAERGLSKQPQARPAIGELVAALEDKPSRRPRVAAAMVLGVAALGTSVAFALRTDDDPACDIDVVGARWDAAKRAAMRASLTGEPAEIDRLLGIFDRRAREIVTRSQETCRSRQDPGLAKRHLACLELRAIELGAAADRQVAARSGAVQAELRFNRTSLPASCAMLEITAPEPAALAPLYAFVYASHDHGATDDIPALEETAVAARAAGDRELAVKAAVLAGSRQRNSDQSEASDQTLQRAYAEATEINSSDGAANALGERLLTINNSSDTVQTRMLGELALTWATKATTTTRTRLRLLRAVARTANARGEPRVAIGIIRDALAGLGNEERNLDVEMLLRHDLAEALLLLDEPPAEAIELAKQAAELGRRLGEKTNNHAVMLNLLAKGYMNNGEHDLALAYRRKALAVWTELYPPDHSWVLEGRVDLGISLLRASQFQLAHDVLADAVSRSADREAMARMYPWMLSRLALAKAELGHHEEALRVFEQAIDLHVARLGADHPQTVSQRVYHGTILFELGRLDEAERVVASIEQTFARKHQGYDKKRGGVRGSLATDLALARGNLDRAETLARGAVTELSEIGASEALAVAQRHLADVLVARGRHAEARTLLEAVLATPSVQRLRADELAQFEVSLGLAERGLGMHEAARARAERLAPILARYPAQVTTRAKLARLLAR